MDYSPPVSFYEHVVEVGSSRDEAPLVIAVDRAEYDAEAKTASIAMGDAFQKSHQIEFYRGESIALFYQDASPDLEACPVVAVPIDDIKRSVDYTANQVTITISNISKELADSIERNLCLLIDADTVKKVANPDFLSAEERARKKKKWFFLND